MESIISNFPHNEIDFDNQFSSENACEEYLFNVKWPQGFICRKCQHTHYWKSNRDLYICSKCQHQHSLTAGTVMENSKKELKMWFKVIWWFTTRKNGVNAKNLQSLLGISYTTAWSWLHKLRKACKNPEREKLSGVVEVDEFYIGGKHEGKQGRGSENKISVAVAVEKSSNGGIGRIRMEVIPNCTAESLNKFVNENITPGSHIKTDGWKGYLGLTKGDEYHHQIEIQHKTGAHLPGVHRVISLFKRMVLGTFHGRIEENYLPQYLEEFTFRFNRKSSNTVGKRFDSLTVLTTIVGYMTINQIVKIFTGAF